MAQVLTLVDHRDLAGRIQALETDGYAYLPAVITRSDVAHVRAATERLPVDPDSIDRYQTPASGGFLNKACNNAFNRDALFLPYLDKPDVIDLAEAVHGRECHVIGMTAWMTGPGRPDQSVPVDWLPLELPEDVLADPRVKVPIFITTAQYYLDDVSEALGPTRIVPGSHRSGRHPAGETCWRGSAEQSVLCQAGDVVVFRSDVWHRGTANTSTQVRYLLQVHYAQRIITQKFPPYPHRFRLNPALLAGATARQRRLLGDHTQGAYD
jgi:hypothetical protein